MSNDLNQGASIEAERADFEAAWRKAYNMPENFPFSKFVDGRYQAPALNDFFDGWIMARRTPAAAASAGELPPLLTLEHVIELIDDSSYEDPETGKGCFDRLGFARAIERAAIEADRAQRQAAPASAQPADPMCSSPEIPDNSNDGAQPDQRESAAEGWQLVPTTLNEAMHAAAVRAIVRCTGNDDFPPAVWAAMLAAAPSPAPVAKEGGNER